MTLNLLLFLMRRRTLAASALAVRAPGPAAFAALPALPERPRAVACLRPAHALAASAGLSVQLDPLNPRAWHAGSADAAPAAPP